MLVSQGTIDNVDPGKLMIPALDALHDTDCLVVVATGGRRPLSCRRLYPHRNVVITDWIDFDAILPHVDVFVCNGGSGSLLLSLSHGVPVVAAGTREGKNDNNAHIDYLGLGINLRTERPTADKLKRAVYTVLGDPGVPAPCGTDPRRDRSLRPPCDHRRAPRSPRPVGNRNHPITRPAARGRTSRPSAAVRDRRARGSGGQEPETTAPTRPALAHWWGRTGAGGRLQHAFSGRCGP